MAWTTVQMRTTTPVFNAGANQANEAGIRVPSIRGAMRFWFRALAGTVTGATTGSQLSLLAAVERRVFGSADAPSPVLLRIPQQLATKKADEADFLSNRPRHESRWIVYLLGQGLYETKHAQLARRFVHAGEAFDLKLRFQHPAGCSEATAHAVEYLAWASLRLMCAFGGVGARTRRGFGGLRITGIDGRAAGTDEDADGLGTDLDFFAGLTHLDADALLPAARGHLSTLIALEAIESPVLPQTQRPAYPVLSAAWTNLGTSRARSPEWRSWSEVLIHAGEEFRHFRASEPYPGAKYHPAIKTPEWAGAVARRGASFPVGALGLPVVYKKEVSVKVSRVTAGEDTELRRASPLWLRPVGEGRRWRLLSFAFSAEFLPGPDAPRVHVWNGRHRPHEVTVSARAVDDLTAQWISTMRSGGRFSDGQTRRPVI